MPDWGGYYTAEFAIAKVDTKTWTASATTRPVTSMSISRSCTDAVSKLESISVEAVGEFEDGWYEAMMIVGPDSVQKVPLGVFRLESSSATYNHGVRFVKAKGESVLSPADGVKIATGEYAPMGADGAEYAASMLRRAFAAPVVTGGSFKLANHIVFGIGMTCLEAVWLILRAGNHCMQLEGNGTVRIMPMPSEPSIDLGRVNSDLLIPGVTEDADISKVCNRYYAVEGGTIAVATNDDPNSRVSRRNVGYWRDTVDKKPVRINGETLQEYAARKLMEQTRITRKISYTREYYPGVHPFSLVKGGSPSVGFDGNMRVMTQQLNCDYGITVNETVEAEVAL